MSMKYQPHDTTLRAAIKNERSRKALAMVLADKGNHDVDWDEEVEVLDSITISVDGRIRVLDGAIVATLKKGGKVLFTIEHISGYRRLVVLKLVGSTHILAYDLKKPGGRFAKVKLYIQPNSIVHGVGELWEPDDFARDLGFDEGLSDAGYYSGPHQALNLRQLLTTLRRYLRIDFIGFAPWTAMALLGDKPIDDKLSLRLLRAANWYQKTGDLQLCNSIVYYVGRNIGEQDRLHTLLVKAFGVDKTRRFKVTFWDEWMAEVEQDVRSQSRAEGRKEGRKEGRTEGRTLGWVKAVLRTVRNKFGAVPKNLENKLQSATEKELERWLDRVSQASTIEELTGGNASGNRKRMQ